MTDCFAEPGHPAKPAAGLMGSLPRPLIASAKLGPALCQECAQVKGTQLGEEATFQSNLHAVHRSPEGNSSIRDDSRKLQSLLR